MKRLSLARVEAIEKGNALWPTFPKPGKPAKPKMPPLSDEVRQEALELLAAGVEQAEVGARLGVDGRRLNGIRRWELPEYLEKQKRSNLVHTEESDGFGSHL